MGEVHGSVGSFPIPRTWREDAHGGSTARRPEARPQRPLPLRVGAEVQEVPRGRGRRRARAAALQGAGGTRRHARRRRGGAREEGERSGGAPRRLPVARPRAIAVAAAPARTQADAVTMVVHMVLFKLQLAVRRARLVRVMNLIGGLRKKLRGITYYCWGPYSSPEGLNRGYTHA